MEENVLLAPGSSLLRSFSLVRLTFGTGKTFNAARLIGMSFVSPNSLETEEKYFLLVVV